MVELMYTGRIMLALIAGQIRTGHVISGTEMVENVMTRFTCIKATVLFKYESNVFNDATPCYQGNGATRSIAFELRGGQ